MNRHVLSVCGVVLLLALVCSARPAKRQENSRAASGKIFSVSGRVATDAKTFIADKGDLVWIIANPEMLVASEGRHVMIRARVDAQTRTPALRVIGVQPDPSAGTRLEDTAFRR
jgi:hypothetical protein